MKFLRELVQLIDALYNWAVLRRKKIQYDSYPIIKGKIAIDNKGTISLGKDVIFNCSLRSNMVGLYKTCTLAVKQNAVLEIGDHSGFSGVSIYCAKKISIGKYVKSGGNVSIWDTDFHPLNFEDRRLDTASKINSAPITIGDDVFIGGGAIILKGVTIGDRSIIGAGSIVTKNIPSDEIWAGNPAKFIKKIIK